MKKSLKKLSPLTESTYYILLSLLDPLHGYGIIKSVEFKTRGRVKLAAGTLYGVLQNLLRHECIKLYSFDETNKKKKEYIITEQGKELLIYEYKRIKGVLKNSKKLEDML